MQRDNGVTTQNMADTGYGEVSLHYFSTRRPQCANTGTIDKPI